MAARKTPEVPVEVTPSVAVVREIVEEVVVSTAIQERDRRVYVAVEAADRVVP